MKNKNNIWKDLFLKKVLIDQIELHNDNMVLEQTQSKNLGSSYQVFEVLICMSLCELYPDFYWHLTPVSRDRGIDVWALKEDRPLPFHLQNTPLVIYGQIKRNASYFGEEKIIEATNKIIRAHKDSYLQKRNVYKIIHLISSDENLRKKILTTPGLVDTLSYIVEIIDAKDIFSVWAINKRYFLASFPVKIGPKEKEELNFFLEQHTKNISDLIKYEIEPPENIPIGANVRFKLTIYNLLQIPFSLDLGNYFLQGHNAK